MSQQLETAKQISQELITEHFPFLGNEKQKTIAIQEECPVRNSI